MGTLVIVYLLLLLILVPLAELALLIRLTQATNLLTTVAVVILTGILGAALARRQGWGVYQRIQSQLAEGKAPAKELLDGLMIFLAGVLLILPGMLTDAVGFLLLIPAVRSFLRGVLARRLVPPGVMEFHSFTVSQFSGRRSGENEIEAEYTVEEVESPPREPRLPKSTD